MAISEDGRGRRWRTASRCSPNGCVSVAQEADGTILVRDTKTPHGPELRYLAYEWDLFIAAVKAGEYDETLSLDDAGALASG